MEKESAHQASQLSEYCSSDCDVSSDAYSESSFDSEPPEIGIDQFGRIAPGPQGLVNYGYRVLNKCISFSGDSAQSLLLSDCVTAFTARNRQEKEVYSAGETYFISADERPRCAMEKLAQDIFRFHSKGLTFDSSNSGAEWWTLVLDDPSDSEVAMHWDKDYGLEEYGVNIFPQISTVTYLSSVGGPTCVLEKSAPPRPGESLVGQAHRAFVSRPQFAKHISFDGRFLHYASADTLPLFRNIPQPFSEQEVDCKASSAREDHNDKARTTFLVNVWFNHMPRDADRLPAEIRNKMHKQAVYSWSDAPIDTEPSLLDCLTPSQVSLSSDYDLFDEYKVKVHLPESALTDSVIINYTSKTAPSICVNLNN